MIPALLCASLLAASPPPPASRQSWREEWLMLSDYLDDLTPAGLENLRQLVLKNPGHFDWRRRYIQALLELGESESAIAQQRALCAATSSREDQKKLASLLLWYNREAEGLTLLRTLDAKEPLPISCLEETCERACLGERWDDAEYFHRQLARRKPGKAPLIALARLLQLRGKWEAALSVWQERFALDEGSPVERLEVSALLRRAGHPEKALAFLDSFSGVSLEEWREKLALAQKLKIEAREEEAMREILRRNPDEHEVGRALVALLEQRAELREADRVMEGLVRRFPDQSQVLTFALSRRLYGKASFPQDLAPMMARLAGLPDPGEQTLQLLVDFYAESSPQKALHFLSLQRRKHPEDGELALKEVFLLDLAGASRRAYLALRELPHPPESLFLAAREKGASRFALVSWGEGSSFLSRSRTQLEGEWRLDDRRSLTLSVAAGQSAWVPQKMGKVGFVRSEGPWKNEASLGILENGDPCGAVDLKWQNGTWAAQAGIQRGPWEESPAGVSAKGRETKGACEVSCSPISWLSLRGDADFGWLRGEGINGRARTLSLETTLNPPGPLRFAHQYRQRRWFSLPDEMSLPTGLSVQSAFIAYNGQFRNLYFELQPGWSQELGTKLGAAVLGGSLTWEAAPVLRIRCSGLYSGTNFNSKMGGDYRSWQTSFSWWF